MRELLNLTKDGLRSEDGSFMVDAWKNASINLLTHAHADHSRPGAQEYWCAESMKDIVLHRLGPETKIRTFKYGEKVKINNNWVSFHPAGHILGSAQIRIEDTRRESRVLVFTGDFKRDDDPSCEPFEQLECETFITEATFGLPIYSWRPGHEIAREILQWWQWNKENNLTSLLFCYSLGKAQRVLAELARLTQDEVLLHGATYNITEIYRAQNVAMVPFRHINEFEGDTRGQLILAPPGAHRSPWMKKFRDVSTGFASGWMAVRGVRRGRNYERGFVLSDHADWKSLVSTVLKTSAKKVYVTHGNKETLAKFLREQHGLDAEPLTTEFGHEDESGGDS